MTITVKPTIAVNLLANMVALSFIASAALDTTADAEDARAAPQKQKKPYAHMKEKTEFAQIAPDAAPDKPNAANDKTKRRQ